MAEKIEVKVSQQLLVEAVEGGLFFVSTVSKEGKTNGDRVAATSAAGLVKLLSSKLGLVKSTRGPRKKKDAAAPAPETK